jgi:hypothetical protein
MCVHVSHNEGYRLLTFYVSVNSAFVVKIIQTTNDFSANRCDVGLSKEAVFQEIEA